ncbi:MAG UNVERIFIED_CONTAM: helix-turn-helix domain-containing protein [Anaerolineae bacterium]|jgi:DNA-binding LacI/PurR family transcriptional regulator
MKKRNSVTQRQIAQQMGVSQTLVSLVLSGSYDVTINHETRQRVLAFAEEMGYVPQAAAKSLSRGLEQPHRYGVGSTSLSSFSRPVHTQHPYGHQRRDSSKGLPLDCGTHQQPQ